MMREALIDAAKRRAPVAVVYDKDGEPCVVVGRVAVVDREIVTITLGNNDVWRLKFSQIQSVEFPPPKGSQAAAGTE